MGTSVRTVPSRPIKEVVKPLWAWCTTTPATNEGRPPQRYIAKLALDLSVNREEDDKTAWQPSSGGMRPWPAPCYKRLWPTIWRTRRGDSHTLAVPPQVTPRSSAAPQQDHQDLSSPTGSTGMNALRTRTLSGHSPLQSGCAVIPRCSEADARHTNRQSRECRLRVLYDGNEHDHRGYLRQD